MLHRYASHDCEQGLRRVIPQYGEACEADYHAQKAHVTLIKATEEEAEAKAYQQHPDIAEIVEPVTENRWGEAKPIPRLFWKVPPGDLRGCQ